MEVASTIALFLVGLFILIRGAQILVKGASSLARILKVSPWFIGVAIVGVGTSVPELAINISAAFNGSTVGIGTIIGSNVFNTLVILGVASFITPIVLKRSHIKDFVINALSVLVAGVFIIFPVLGDPSFVGVTSTEGYFLFALFIVWLIFMFGRKGASGDYGDFPILTASTSVVMVLAGILGVLFGGEWVVQGAESFALYLGVSPSLVALTIVGIGTSLPELTVSIVAALKKNMGIAVGNVIGSNIFDFLGIIGIAAILHPISILSSVRFDIAAAFIATALLLLFVLVGRKLIIGRFECVLFWLAYIVYLAVFIWRG